VPATWAGKIPVTQVNNTTKSFTISTNAGDEDSVPITTEPENNIQSISVKITMNENAQLPVKKGTITRVVIQVTDE
jgi:hypothetical protein